MPAQGPGEPALRPPSPSPRSGLATVFVLIPSLVVLFTTVAILAFYGIRKYLTGAKTVESVNSLGAMARGAVEAYEADHRVCPSASWPIPRDLQSIRGKKYVSSPREWEVDRPTHAGFSCLAFSMEVPQSYQYAYSANGVGFEVVAHGDLDGDGVFSTFTLSGEVMDGQLRVAPSFVSVNPEQ